MGEKGDKNKNKGKDKDKEKLSPGEYAELDATAKNIVSELKRLGLGREVFYQSCRNAIRTNKALNNDRFGYYTGICVGMVAREFKRQGLDKEEKIAVGPQGDVHHTDLKKTEPRAVAEKVSNFSDEEFQRMLIGAKRKALQARHQMGDEEAEEIGY